MDGREEQLSMSHRKRYAVNALRLATALAVLIGSISAAHSLLDLSGGVAIVVGILSGYGITKVILRYVPEVPAASDFDLAHMRIGGKWLIWMIATLLILHFLAALGWVIAVGLAVAVGMMGVVVDWWVRAQARTRLENGS